MGFFDETEGLEGGQEFRQEAEKLEERHLALRRALGETEAALRADPGNTELAARRESLEKQLAELDRQAPWISAEHPPDLPSKGASH
jgi:hypothetical protein